MWLLLPFRSCIKLLKLNSCQFTSKQLGSHWCCLSRGASSTQQVSTHFILIQIIASLRLQYNTKVLGTIKRTFQLRTPLKRANSNTLLIFWTFWSWFQFPDHKIFSLLLRICIAVILLAFELRRSHKKKLHFWRAPCMFEWPDFLTPISSIFEQLDYHYHRNVDHCYGGDDAPDHHFEGGYDIRVIGNDDDDELHKIGAEDAKRDFIRVLAEAIVMVIIRAWWW